MSDLVRSEGSEAAFDILIAGAGPAGLCFAAALENRRLRIALIDRQPLGSLCDPAVDGREIALTHASVQSLKDLRIWPRIAADEVSRISDVRVFNGASARCMHIGHVDGGADELGYLVANHLIRRAAYQTVRQMDHVTLLADTSVTEARWEAAGVRVRLSDGRVLRAPLLVAADSRFSEVRRMAGIPARSRDFGKTMLVCRMEHEKPHGQAASEWFDHGQTLALLPLTGNRSSAVITLPGSEARRLKELDAMDFDLEVERRYRSRLGWMRRTGEVFAYPLVAVLADRFAGPRIALLGDAAVGMHPATAHGFNLGLRGAERLAREIDRAAFARRDIGAPGVLTAYERAHRRAALPLYGATNAIVGLSTPMSDCRPVSRARRWCASGIGSGPSNAPWQARSPRRPPPDRPDPRSQAHRCDTAGRTRGGGYFPRYRRADLPRALSRPGDSRARITAPVARANPVHRGKQHAGHDEGQLDDHHPE